MIKSSRFLSHNKPVIHRNSGRTSSKDCLRSRSCLTYKIIFTFLSVYMNLLSLAPPFSEKQKTRYPVRGYPVRSVSARPSVRAKRSELPKAIPCCFHNNILFSFCQSSFFALLPTSRTYPTNFRLIVIGSLAYSIAVSAVIVCFAYNSAIYSSIRTMPDALLV